MLLEENKEYEGVVVDNVDRLGKSRLRVFIFGYHDLTGTRIKIEHLPWAFSGQLQNFQSTPQIGSIVKVKFNFSNHQNMTWYPTSQYTKTGSKVKSPLPFLVYNPETEKFINSFNAYNDQEQATLDSQIQELENQKAEYESQLQQLKNDLNSTNDESQNLDNPITVTTLNSQIKELGLRIDQNIAQETSLRNNYQSRILSGNNAAKVLWNSDAAIITSEGRIPSGEDKSFATLEEYQQEYNAQDQDIFNEELKRLSLIHI